ncbi:MAG: glycosyltransferase family 10 [Asticcacaulis sp.]
MRLAVHPFGKYSHRQPFAYAPIQQACADTVQVTDRFEDADVVIVAHFKDIVAHGDMLKRRLRHDQRLVLLSEEPFWDSVWANTPLKKQNGFQTESGWLPFTYLNHHTSRIYAFDYIPYFLLTNEDYTRRYREWFERNALLTRDDWRNNFKQTSIDIVFLAEYRNENRFDIQYPQGDILGLSTLRTQIALKCSAPRKVVSGTGWQAGFRRQQLSDWHLDKFQTYDGRCRFFSAIENTHQPDYVSEKIFDAYALGAVPVYIAGPQHRVRQFAVQNSWVNLWGLTPDAADTALNSFRFDDDFLSAYMHSQLQMALLFGAPTYRQRELKRLKTALLGELVSALTEKLI